MDYNLYDLQRALDQTKAEVFLGSDAAYFGPLMCSLEFSWTESIKTAATDGVRLMWSPKFFMELRKPARRTVLMHELWHPARMHMSRVGDRNHRVFNYACDIRINNNLERDGYSFDQLHSAWKDQSVPDGMVEEDIYDMLMQMGGEAIIPAGPNSGITSPDNMPNLNDGDIFTPTEEDMRKAVANAVRASHEAIQNGGKMPGDTELVFKQFLAPVVPWTTILGKFMTELVNGGRTWMRPNRRHQEYMPSRYQVRDKLTHIICYQDASGSILDADNVRFNSELKYIWDVYRPDKLTIIMFDDKIQNTVEFNKGDEFNEVKVIGRGGTDLEPVRQHMLKHKPTAAIIFTDHGCEPMQPLGLDIPTIWIIIRNKGYQVPFGQTAYIR